ncbi:glycosyltransferase family 4 protein [Aquihabitans sp. McL0605]|uniref:glycosyltransferase family 4 protein n=1 Tax=Aquihabitans sp. McL0605 TaxID=3415671 RepID=UPI003CF93DD4
MSRPPVLWAILHDLDRSGVPVALARLVRWQARVRPDAVEIHILAGRDGPLRTELASVAASVTALEPAIGRSRARSTALALAELGASAAGRQVDERWIRHRVRRLPRPDVVLVQGAGAWPTFEAVEPSIGQARVVAHLHELDVALSRSVHGAQAEALLLRPEALLAVGPAVADLAVRSGAPSGRLTIVPGSVDDPPGGWDAALAPGPRSALVSIGTAGWRKGTDLAIAGAHELGRTHPAARWHWVGAPEPSPWRLAAGSSDPLVRHPATEAPWSAVTDVAALVVPSREDPLPLVALEAGSRGVPVVAVRTGDLAALLAADRGLLAAPGDLSGLVAAATACLDQPGAADQRALALRRYVRDEHATVVVGPRWLDAVLGA